uniref:Uncharacterized protein LOC114342064 n=1 Tax=Diabrotica virgifera virgifera TaxID=50390 RepID=A0A6P7GTH4_DIAVI
MGQHPSKDKFARSASERIDRKEKYPGSIGKERYSGTIGKKGSAKKRADVVQVTQVLTANKLPARAQQNTAAENKKNATLHSSPTADPKTRRTIFSSKDKKPSTIK